MAKDCFHYFQFYQRLAVLRVIMARNYNYNKHLVNM